MIEASPMKQQANSVPLSTRCGIVLAAGEGKRLQPFIRQWRGDALPKQYVTFTGTGSMLEHTYHRAERLIPAEFIFTVINPRHLAYPEVYRQLCGRPRGTVVLQPKNKETGPGLLLPLMHLFKHHPESTVAVFPSDHYIEEESLFTDYVDLAFRLTEEDPSKVILLGVQPHGPDPEYGYILPGEEIKALIPSGAKSILRFIEKPAHHTAQELVRQGGLWNTMVMVFKAKRLLELIQRSVPNLYDAFEKIGEVIGAPCELDRIEALYADLPSMNFSKEVLETIALRECSSLITLPVRNVYWNDWGSIQRLRGDLSRISLRQRDAVQEDQYAAA